MRFLGRAFLAGALGALALAPSAMAADATAAANGNAITGGLSFTPAAITVAVGDSVTWTNTDFLAPHTVTEDHGLFALTGTYGPPVAPAGFAPGQSVSRQFAAGTFHYYCEVHPGQMLGAVAATMRLSSHPVTRKRTVKRKRKHGHGKRKRKRVVRVAGNEITAVWGAAALPRGQVFDVQSHTATGPWTTVRDGVQSLSGAFDGGKAGSKTSFRARVRRDTDPGGASASDWSPAATITVG